MTKYQIEKEKARQMAIELQNDFENHNYSWYELYIIDMRLKYLACRYGLKKEFKENGIL